MTETNKILAVICEAYPLFLKDRNPQVTSVLWQKLFADDPYDFVETALMAFIATDTKGFPPSVGAIKEQIRLLKQTEEMTEQEAWALVAKACANSTYNAKEEFNKLPESLRRLVGSPDQLHSWAMMDEDEVQTVIASNFQRSYRARQESQKRFDMLPSAMHEVAKKLSEGNAEAQKLFRLEGEDA